MGFWCFISVVFKLLFKLGSQIKTSFICLILLHCTMFSLISHDLSMGQCHSSFDSVEKQLLGCSLNCIASF